MEELKAANEVTSGLAAKIQGHEAAVADIQAKLDAKVGDANK